MILSYTLQIVISTFVFECLLCKFREAGMTSRHSKCVIGVRKVNFLGQHVGEGIIGLRDKNMLKIKNAPQPQTKKKVRSFLGLTSYYRDYISNYAAIAVPLSDLTLKGNPNVVQWDVAQDPLVQCFQCTQGKFSNCAYVEIG